MSIAGLLFLLVAQYLSGGGLLKLFRLKLNTTFTVAFSFINGVIILSFVPFILQLLSVPITFLSVFTVICVVTIIFSFSLFRQFHVWSFSEMKNKLIPAFKLYEIPYLVIFAVIILSSVWRCFYYPPFARDMLSGPEVVAEYAVKEHSLINSVLSANIETTNNHLKPPFITGLQVVYKLFGFPFGQVWLSVFFVAFVAFLYRLLKEKLHPVIGGLLLLLFLSMQETFSYSFIMLFDYPCMILFFIAVFCFHEFLKSRENNLFYFSVLLFGFATFIRSETPVFVYLLLPAFWMHTYKNKAPFKSAVFKSLIFIVVPFLFYFAWIHVFLKYYMPVHFELKEQLTGNFLNVDLLFKRFYEMNTGLIFSTTAIRLWGYFFFVFLGLLLAELIVFRKINKETRFWLYAVAAVYFGFPLLGCLTPLFDLNSTTKRGFFKLLPLMLLVMCNSSLLKKLSDRVEKWEKSITQKLVAKN